MPSETASDSKFEIGHVLFIDIVGYSKLVIEQQREAQRQLNETVRHTEQFKLSEVAGKLVRLPTGDGMALVFRDSAEAPALCASQIARRLATRPDIPVRMGIHSGPVSDINDVNERENIAGDGVNIAQRVMDCGDAGHILLSKRVADDLSQYGRWRTQLHPLGEVEVKHGLKIDIFNLAGDGIGNPVLPEKIAGKRIELERAAKRARRRRRVLLLAAAGVTAAALILSVLAYRMRKQLAKLTAIPEKSIAVLPFENLSADPTNALFVTGVQDEILTRAAKIAALKVIARTSTQRYEAKPGNLGQVAKELGVAHILEGSVQKISNKVHVNVQLIKAATAAHVWAESYDRELTDVFGVEAEIASRIANALSVVLTPDEEKRINAIPTTNPDAYEAYMEGREMRIAPASYMPEYDNKQREHYERAIALDPDFALAHAALSFWYSIDALDGGVTPENKIKAHTEAEEALRLQPDLGEAHFALGTYYYGAEHAYGAADKEFAIALRTLPNDAELLRIRAQMNRRQSHWRAAIEGLHHATSLDPRNLITIMNLAAIYTDVRDYATAEETRRREVDVGSSYSPEAAIFAKRRLVVLQWIRTGNLAPMQSLFDELPKDFDPALRGLILQDIGSTKRDPDLVLEGVKISGDKQDLTQFFGVVQTLLVKGDVAGANEVLDRLIAEKEAQIRQNPEESIFHSHLGLFCAYRGRKEEAVREGRRAVELLPENKDAALAPTLESYLARIYARVGEPEKALDLIEHLLTIPCEEDATMSKRELEVDWGWDPLRQNPHFQKILSSPQPKTIYN
jgi:TolB-like protein/Flp pilus assembly protein TadD